MDLVCFRALCLGPEIRSYPLKNRAKGDGFGLFLCTVPGAQVPGAIEIAEHAGGDAPPGASMCFSAGRREGGRGNICHSLSEVKGSFEPLSPLINPIAPPAACPWLSPADPEGSWGG